MDEARRVADRLRWAELELQLAQRAFDGSEQARARYARALQEMEAARRHARRIERGVRPAANGLSGKKVS